MALNAVTVDPIKYLSKLPVYNGSFSELYTFIDLVDRITQILETYDDLSKGIFLDIIKSKLSGPAKDISEINNHLTRWTELKETLINNFGDRLTDEQLYDKLRSVKFKTNAKNFYDEIITYLRRLNMKTRSLHQNEAGYNALIAANKRVALDVFKNKLIEPMRSIIICRNPNNIENAMKILYDTNYAFYNPNPIPNKNETNSTHDNRNKSVNQNTNFNKNQNYKYQNQRHRQNQHQNQNYTRYQDQYQNYIPRQNDSNNRNNPFQNNTVSSDSTNQPINDSDRPTPMDIGNFCQTAPMNSPT